MESPRKETNQLAARFRSCAAWMKKVGVDYRAIKMLSVVSIITSSLIVVATLDGETVNPKILLLSLVQLENNLHNETKPEARIEIAKSILNTGASLSNGPMAPSIAKSVAKSRTSGSELPDDQKGYAGFWLLRAVAAVLANDEVAGAQAAAVLNELGMAKSDKPAEMNIMASLLTKGWFDPQKDEVRALQELSTSIMNSLCHSDSEKQSLSALIKYLEKSNAYPLDRAKHLDALVAHIPIQNRTDISKTKFVSLMKDLSKLIRTDLFAYYSAGDSQSPELPTPQELAMILQSKEFDSATSAKPELIHVFQALKQLLCDL